MCESVAFLQIMGDGPMRFDGLETVESRQHWIEDMDVDVSAGWGGGCSRTGFHILRGLGRSYAKPLAN